MNQIYVRKRRHTLFFLGEKRHALDVDSIKFMLGLKLPAIAFAPVVVAVPIAPLRYISVAT